MARRYEPSLAVSPAGTSSAAVATQSTLASTLTSFRNRATEFGAARGARRGAAAGAASTGKPTLRNELSASGRAYNNAAIRNYVIEHYENADIELGRVEHEAGSNPEKFRTLAEGVRRGALSGALPEARGELTEIYARRIAEGTQRLQHAQRTEQRAYNKAILAQGLETVSDSISRKMTSGDQTLMAQAQDEELQYQLMIDGAVADATLTPAEGVTLLTDSRKRVTRQIVTGQFEHELREGDPLGFIGRVMAQPVEDLSDDEKGAVVSQLFERMNRWQSLAAEGAQLEDAERKGRWRDGERQATVGTLRRALTIGDITDMVARDELDPAVGRTLVENLSSPTRNIDDQRLLLDVETNLLAYDEEDIAGMGGLSHATRADLILKRRADSEGWRNEPGAQEALRRIDVALGIPAGLGPQFQIAITPEKATAAAKARSFFYDLVEGTPEPERKAKMFALADEAIATMQSDVRAIELSDVRDRLSSYQRAVGDPEAMNEDERAEYDATVKRYQERIGVLEAGE
jgi:hypothetical protein